MQNVAVGQARPPSSLRRARGGAGTVTGPTRGRSMPGRSPGSARCAGLPGRRSCSRSFPRRQRRPARWMSLRPGSPTRRSPSASRSMSRRAGPASGRCDSARRPACSCPGCRRTPPRGTSPGSSSPAPAPAGRTRRPRPTARTGQGRQSLSCTSRPRRRTMRSTTPRQVRRHGGRQPRPRRVRAWHRRGGDGQEGEFTPPPIVRPAARLLQRAEPAGPDVPGHSSTRFSPGLVPVLWPTRVPGTWEEVMPGHAGRGFGRSLAVSLGS